MNVYNTQIRQLTYFPGMSLLLQPEDMLQAEEVLDDTGVRREVWQVQVTDEKAQLVIVTEEEAEEGVH